MLTPKQRRHLKSLAHHIDPTIRIGRARLSGAVVAETDRALQAHELIKVKIEMEAAPERRDLAASIASATGAEVVSTIGKIAIVYRPRAEKPKIKLPR